MNKINIEKNREYYLSEMRSGKYKKGTIKSDTLGNPIINSPEDDDGCCACGLMVMLFIKDGKSNFKYAKNQLGVTNEQCSYIQKEISDTNLSFSEMADRIDIEIFSKKKL